MKGALLAVAGYALGWGVQALPSQSAPAVRPAPENALAALRCPARRKISPWANKPVNA